MPLINKTVLVSGANYFTDKDAINALMDSSLDVDVGQAVKEHQSIIKAFKKAGIKVIEVKAPKGMQDGVYTANWALVRAGKAVLARLPNKRKPEELIAKLYLSDLGLEIHELPESIRAYSGQGDSLVLDDVLFIQSPYRTSKAAHLVVKNVLGFKEVYSLTTKPQRWFKFGPARNNKITGWPDSPTFDLDLALAVIKPATENSPPLIAYCPRLFKRPSRKILKDLNGFDKLIISKDEALKAYAPNLVSTGETVIMNSGAPKFKADLVKHGLKVIELDLPELKKGGGSIRCTSLTLD
jgi:N-dimethylarginine dimethylaminohydrolase